MKSFPPFAGRRRARTDSARRARLLAAFDRSGLSAAAFARRHQLNYTTFCGWRQCRTKAKTPIQFAQVELSSPGAPDEPTLELVPGPGAPAVGGQLALAAQFR